MTNVLMPEYDVIIIGSGVSGLVTALKLKPNKKVLVLSKDAANNSNTNLAQGGIAVTFDAKKFESHIQDTLKAGNFYNDEDRLRLLIEEGGKSVNNLIEWGVNFDKDASGNLLLTKEGGHSERRIIHYKDTTGAEIIRGLLEYAKQQENITLLEYAFAEEILKNDDGVCGIQLLFENQCYQVKSKYVVLATGGIGELYANTTNASIATGDGIAMAYRIGAKIKDMEFVQFHPTALNVPGHSHFLISEAVRGEGGILRNEKGEAFMASYHVMQDLAPRSVVSKAIFEQIKLQNSNEIYLDVTHLDSEFVKSRFPNIYNECFKRGIDITKSYIPVTPVQHYIMGGVETDHLGSTNIPGLMVCGECACTGVHGANRMASNSLLEGIVFANRVADYINDHQRTLKNTDLFESQKTQSSVSAEDVKRKLQDIMSGALFIFRNQKAMLQAKKEIEALREGFALESSSQKSYEVYNMLIVATIIVDSALKRETSLGSHIVEGEK
ncbi:MAG: L-aspartate oxidase [Clostridia bacterium]|nr:L-aspartate oxidase [Clostridia bacterium]